MTGQSLTSLRTILFVIATVGSLGMLWWLLAPTTQATATANQSIPAVSFELDLTQQNEFMPQHLSATQGASITFTLRVAKADTLHLHGYDLHQKVQAHSNNVVQFVANRSGRFDMELHDSDAHIATLEIYPAR